MDHMIENVGVAAAVVLPLFNIPLILKIRKRRSSQDLSITWVIGVWTCILLMAPSGFRSVDVVWKTFNIVNIIFFTMVVIVTLKYRKGVAND